jgi:hypothetical protein
LFDGVPSPLVSENETTAKHRADNDVEQTQGQLKAAQSAPTGSPSAITTNPLPEAGEVHPEAPRISTAPTEFSSCDPASAAADFQLHSQSQLGTSGPSAAAASSVEEAELVQGNSGALVKNETDVTTSPAPEIDGSPSIAPARKSEPKAADNDGEQFQETSRTEETPKAPDPPPPEPNLTALDVSEAKDPSGASDQVDKPASPAQEQSRALATSDTGQSNGTSGLSEISTHPEPSPDTANETHPEVKAFSNAVPESSALKVIPDPPSATTSQSISQINSDTVVPSVATAPSASTTSVPNREVTGSSAGADFVPGMYCTVGFDHSSLTVNPTARPLTKLEKDRLKKKEKKARRKKRRQTDDDGAESSSSADCEPYLYVWSSIMTPIQAVLDAVKTQDIRGDLRSRGQGSSLSTVDFSMEDSSRTEHPPTDTQTSGAVDSVPLPCT